MLIWLTGRIAAGKWMIVEYLKDRWFEYFTISQVVREEAQIRWVDITRKNLQDIWNEVRQNEWAGAWICRLISKMESGKDYIIDWIRNPGEIVELRKQKDFHLISIDADQEIRFDRMLKRAKDSDPKTWELFLEIDDRDFGESDPLGQQVGKCMDLSDYKIENNWTLEQLHLSIENIYKKIKN